jgi:hypothetical protein
VLLEQEMIPGAWSQAPGIKYFAKLSTLKQDRFNHRKEKKYA